MRWNAYGWGRIIGNENILVPDLVKLTAYWERLLTKMEKLLNF